MQTIEYRFRDKSDWGPGEWHDEPDKRQWQDEATGLPCLIVRGPSGALCGYVGVSRSHPDYEQDYDQPDVDVHGGLTFASKCSPNKEHGVCHIVSDGEDDDVWWLGFDCAHLGDVSPAHDRHYGREETSSYKSFPYVTAEVTRLAAQLAARQSCRPDKDQREET